MATLALVLDHLGTMELGEQVKGVFPGAASELAVVSLASLLRHCGGLQPWAPLALLCQSLAEVDEYLTGGNCLGAEPGTYGDLGYILWSRCAEKHTGLSLRQLVHKYLVAGGLKVMASGDFPPREANRCRVDGRREAELARDQGFYLKSCPAPMRGEVQDGNARFLGGLAGHAGLFASAADLWRLGALWLSPQGLLTRTTVENALGGEGKHALGWWRGPFDASASGVLSDESFGHPGFTGSCLWVDPRRELVLVLAAHRTSVEVDMTPWRRRYFEAVVSQWPP
jgi:CubicO group peptidase (beta-lactamase class C family)